MAIPKAMQEKYDEIAPLIVEFCEDHLDEDYAAICLRLLEKLCRKRPSPLLKGMVNTWAAGIVYEIASLNFIFDKTIHITCPPMILPMSLISRKAPPATKPLKFANLPTFPGLIPSG